MFHEEIKGSLAHVSSPPGLHVVSPMKPGKLGAQIGDVSHNVDLVLSLQRRVLELVFSILKSKRVM